MNVLYCPSQLADCAQVGDWILLPMASIVYSSAPDGVGYWCIKMHGSNPKNVQKLDPDHPEVVRRKQYDDPLSAHSTRAPRIVQRRIVSCRYIEEHKIAFPKRASLIDTDEDHQLRLPPARARKLLATTTNQAYTPDSIRDVLLEQVWGHVDPIRYGDGLDTLPSDIRSYRLRFFLPVQVNKLFHNLFGRETANSGAGHRSWM